MGRRYTINFNSQAITAQQDLFEIVAGSSNSFKLIELYLSQLSEVGDAQEEGLNILVKSGQTTSGSGGNAGTAVSDDFGDSAAGLTAEVNNTTKASAGTIVIHRAWNWNIRAPFQYIWLPPQMVLRPSRRLTVELATTPADSITMSGYLTVEEAG